MACLLLMTSLAFASAHAQRITPALKACMNVPDGPARLACYDREMRRIEGGAAASVASAASPASPPPASPPAASLPSPSSAAVARQQQFGLPPDADREPRMPSRITARVASVTRQPSGRYMITLDNGEVWLQTQDQFGFAPHTGSSVSIKRGMLGAYWMSDKYYVVGVRRVR